MANVKMLLIDVVNNEVKKVTAGDYKEYHSLLNCELFDVVRRRIGTEQRVYEFVCDDMGLLKENPTVSAINGNEVMFVGNLLIAGLVDFEGEFTDITDDDVNYIENYVKYMIDLETGAIRPILTSVSY